MSLCNYYRKFRNSGLAAYRNDEHAVLLIGILSEGNNESSLARPENLSYEIGRGGQTLECQGLVLKRRQTGLRNSVLCKIPPKAQVLTNVLINNNKVLVRTGGTTRLS